MEVTISLPLAFAAGLVSFLSPCILPIVPTYVAFVSGLTFGELSERPTGEVRRKAAIHSVFFVLGFSIVFMTLGLAATAMGPAIAQSLPWINRVGGIVVIFFALHLLGLVQIPALAREWRVRSEKAPLSPLGALLVGVGFGAGWSPCIGPVLATILLYASLEATMASGVILLGTYALGLGIPFVAASMSINWFLAGSQAARRWIRPIQRVAGTVLFVIGLLMVTGHFATMTAALADMGQLITLEPQ